MTLAEPAEWATLEAPGKRARILEVAGELFAREGLDVPMPRLAQAVGVGVGSIYRQVGRKEDIVAALVVVQLDRMVVRLEQALTHDDPWRALCAFTRELVDATLVDSVAQEGWAMSLDRPEVARRKAVFASRLDALVDRARTAGALREDATTLDLRLLFRSAGAAEQLAPGGARRLAELVLRGMSAPR